MKLIGGLLLTILVLVVVVPILALGYLFTPGKPRNLGITFTEADRAAARAKSQVEYEVLPPETAAEKSIVRSGSRKVQAGFSSQEITALMNDRPWRYWPYEDVQVKFNADGSGEISGILLRDKVVGYGAAIGLPREAIEFVVKFLPTNPVFYVKMKAVLAENKVSVFEPEAFEIGRVPLPVGMFLALNRPRVAKEAKAIDIGEMTSQLSKVSNKKQLIIDYINQRLTTFTGFYAKSAKIGENKLTFEGNLPEKEATVR